MIRYTSEIRVRYADTDQMKNVYYGKYLEYFEQARSDLFRALGLPYSELERRGLLLPVIEAFARYKRPACYDDLLSVETMLPDIAGARIRLDYSIVRKGESEILVEGYTAHAFVSASTGKPIRAPEFILRTVNKALNAS